MATPKRSDRKKAASLKTRPAPRMIRSVNKYGFNVLIPATETIDVTVRRGGKNATAKHRSISEVSSFDDASIDDTPVSPTAEPHDGNIEGSVLGKHSHRDSDDGFSDEVVRMKSVEVKEKEDVDEGSLEAQSKQSSKSAFCKDVSMQEAGEQGNWSNDNRDVDMEGLDGTSEDVVIQLPGHHDIDPQTVRHIFQGSIQGEKAMATEAMAPSTAEVSIKAPTSGSLFWRAAEKVTATGVHLFNMPVKELREMTRLQAIEQAQKRHPQSSSELRALFVSATTDNHSSPEEYAIANARVKLQAGRIAMYSVQLKERMDTMRMFAARASQQPRDLVDRLAANVVEAHKELIAAQKTFDGNIQDVAIAEQALTNVTGVPVPESHDIAIEEDALRRDNMIDEINAAIEEYEAQVRA